MTMDLLPTTHQEFSSTDYWDKFFKKRAKTFEWYGEYAELCAILHRYIKLTDRTLVVGCGNSSLSADMHDMGYKNLINIDNSEVVIRQMGDKHKAERPDLKFIRMDALEMEFEDEHFNVVLDKATLDALMTDSSKEVTARIEKYFTEILRVLKVGGRYVCVTLAQHHILQYMVTHFCHLGCPLRICKIEQDESKETQTEFHLPVFAVIVTKFKKLPKMKQILELSQTEGNMERYNTIEDLIKSVKSMQYYGLVRHRLQNQNNTGDQICLHLFTADSPSPRYTLYIVDVPVSKDKKFAVFIVPTGRDVEWLFSSDHGRLQLAESAGFDRLVIVTLHPDHTYTNLDEVKMELSSRIMELAPSKLGNVQVPFLSVGDQICNSKISYHGNHEHHGDYVVEDVNVDGCMFRRLVFHKNRELLCEVKLIPHKKGGARKKNKKGTLIPDRCHVCATRHVSVIASLALLPDFITRFNHTLHVAVFGLGAGVLSMCLTRILPNIVLDVVTDDALSVVAKQWFALEQTDHLHIFVNSYQQYLLEAATEGKEFNIIITDDITEESTQCIEEERLNRIFSLLKINGMLILTLPSCTDEASRTAHIDVVRAVFKTVFSHFITQQQETIVCALKSKVSQTSDMAQKQLCNLLTDYLKCHGLSQDNLSDVDDALNALMFS